MSRNYLACFQVMQTNKAVKWGKRFTPFLSEYTMALKKKGKQGPEKLRVLVFWIKDLNVFFVNFLKVCWSQHCVLHAVLQATGEPSCSPSQGLYENQHARRKTVSCRRPKDPHEQDLGLSPPLWDPSWQALSAQRGEGTSPARFLHQDPAWWAWTGLRSCLFHNCDHF